MRSGVVAKKLSERQLSFRRFEIREMAKRIMEVISILEQQDKSARKLIAAVREILRCKALGKEPQADDFKIFVRTLNAKVIAHQQDFGLASENPPRRPPLRGYSARGLADAVNRFLQCFRDTPSLGKENPFAVCEREPCGKLFLKVRSDQEYCSSKCKSKRWNKDKWNKDRDYFARVAKDYRNRQPS